MSTDRPTKLKLLWPGTKVYTWQGSARIYGTVELYEHYSPNQVTFPVKFGPQSIIMTSADVTALPEAQQPPGREPARRTGRWSQTPAARKLLKAVPTAPPEPGAPAAARDTLRKTAEGAA